MIVPLKLIKKKREIELFMKLFIIFMILSEYEFELLKKRDPGIFEKLFTEYGKKIYNFLIVKTGGNDHLADDIFSDTFHSALVSAPKLKENKNIQAWLFQLAGRRFIDSVRKMYREKKYMEIIHSQQEQQTGIVDEIEKNEKILLLNMALDNLKPDYKNLIRMKYIDKIKIKEIAEKTGKNMNAVKSTLIRAKNSLKKEVQKLSEKYFEEAV